MFQHAAVCCFLLKSSQLKRCFWIKVNKSKSFCKSWTLRAGRLMYIILLGILYQDNWVIERPTTCRYSRQFVSFQKWTWSSFRYLYNFTLQNACIWFLLSYYYIGVAFLPFIHVCNFKEVFNYGQPHLLPCRVPIYFCLWLIICHCFVLLFHLVTSINLHICIVLSSVTRAL